MEVESGTSERDRVDVSTIGGLLDDVAGHLNAQHGRLLDLTVWLVANPAAWSGDGVWSIAQYLGWRCGISPNTARNLVAAAERVDELPVSIDALRRGELSLDQLMPIVRKVPAWGDAQVVSLAKRLTVSQISRTVNRMDWSPKLAVVVTPAPETGPVTPTEPDSAGGADEAVPDDANRVWFATGDDGRWHLHADLDLDLGELVAAALDEARDALFHQHDSAHAGSVHAGSVGMVSDVDGLMELVRRSLDAAPSVERRSRYRVNLYLNIDSTLSTDRGVVLPESIARYLTCDGAIDPVYVENGVAVSVGRSQRTIPDRTRRIVLKRDGHRCQVPGCTTSRGLDLHHIVHWSKHGPTDTWNLIAMCARHHRMHHHGRLGLSGNADQPDTVQFTDARGRPIRASGANPKPPTRPPPPIHGVYQHPYGERLDSRWVTINHPDNARRAARSS
jgi:Domain of unknown function (DUF222)